MAIRGVMAIMAMQPKASTAGFPPKVLDEPSMKARIKVDAMGPDATPPESKAIAVNMRGQKRMSSMDAP